MLAGVICTMISQIVIAYIQNLKQTHIAETANQKREEVKKTFEETKQEVKKDLTTIQELVNGQLTDAVDRLRQSQATTDALKTIVEDLKAEAASARSNGPSGPTPSKSEIASVVEEVVVAGKASMEGNNV